MNHYIYTPAVLFCWSILTIQDILKKSSIFVGLLFCLWVLTLCLEELIEIFGVWKKFHILFLKMHNVLNPPLKGTTGKHNRTEGAFSCIVWNRQQIFSIFYAEMFGILLYVIAILDLKPGMWTAESKVLIFGFWFFLFRVEDEKWRIELTLRLERYRLGMAVIVYKRYTWTFNLMMVWTMRKENI